MPEDLSTLTNDELVKRVAEIEKRRAEKLDTHEQARKRRVLEGRVLLAQLEDEHGVLGIDIQALFSPADGSMVVVKKPKPVTYETYQTKYLRNNVTPKDTTDFVYANLVYPDRQAFQRIVDGCADMTSSAALACAELGGAGKADIAGK